MNDDVITEEILAAMGISQPVYEEVRCIVGHLPTVDELGTLMAMWESNGRQTSLLNWLKGQFHATEHHDYLYHGSDEYRQLHEPKVKECLTIARSLFGGKGLAPRSTSLQGGLELYLVGDISTEFLSSDYARQYLHIADIPMDMGSAEEDRAYRLMILEALQNNGNLLALSEVGQGGLFRTLLSLAQPIGFDLLTCREIRLDAFLFGEESGRFVVALAEKDVDYFLQKLSEAGINCCMIGHTTSGRIVVDGMDFGPSMEYGLID
ncbi:MAG: hypothetical protein HUK17_02195 [Bacteroidales bacterium]|nr:hypothetical protein [Bacteroidales bacterium]